MSKLEKQKDRARALEAKDPRGAVDAWLDILKTQEAGGEANPDLAVYNRIGDLLLKVKEPAQAADYYDKAVDKYAELGFHNNAIAMCNKVLRNAPARQTTYLKLAKLYAAKGFLGEAKQNFVEYAERMQRAGKIEHAFSALKEVADLSAGGGLREMLEEHLRMYGGAGARPSGRPSTPAATPEPHTGDAGKSGSRKTSSLVFLDVDAPPVPKGAKAAPPKPPAPEPVGIMTQPEPEPDSSIEIETTSLADDAEEAGGGTLDGLELTSTDFESLAESTPSPSSLREELPPPDDALPLAGLEPTVEEEEELPAPPPPPRAPPKMPQFKTPAPRGAPEPPKVKPVVPRGPAAAPPPAPKAPPASKAPPTSKGPPPTPKASPPPPARKTVVDIPALELEPDFDSLISDDAHEVDDEPLALDDGGNKFITTEDDTSISSGRKTGYIDLGVDGIINQGDMGAALVFDNIEVAPAAAGIEELEGRVADNPDDPEAHQALGEALIEAGQRERGIEELDMATAGFETTGQLEQARELVEEMLRLDPNSIRHRQKAVEFAFKAGDKPKLIDAYLELADTLLRGDLPDKAHAVYQRVAEHDPGNQRAKAALSMFAPPAATKPEGKVKAKDAKMTVRHDAATEGDFVDLSSMILDDVEPEERDTRMKVADEEPTGDEELDFHEMLARFKQGIDENIDEADFQSHYDLGVAFKEMGLLDEAIAQFQKALRAPDGKLRTTEALGVCFFEKGAHTVAESILRRGLDIPASGDQERLGVLYWLGRALEEQGNGVEARELYGRVFAVDIRFRDVGERVKALAKARR